MERNVTLSATERIKFCRKSLKYFVSIEKVCNFATSKLKNVVFVAQLVEQLTLNQWVQGSSPCKDTFFKCHFSSVGRATHS